MRIHALEQHLYLASLRRELDRVGQQVPYHLLQAPTVPADDVLARPQDRLQTDALGLCGRLGRVNGSLYDAGKCDLMKIEPQLARHDSAQVQKIVDELNLRARVAVDDFDGPLLLFGSSGCRSSEQHLRPAQN